MRRGQRKGEQLAPIARWEPAADGDDVLLTDTRATSMFLGIGARTVRRYDPIACDLATRAPLWDLFAVGAAREQTKAREPRTAPGLPLAS